MKTIIIGIAVMKANGERTKIRPEMDYNSYQKRT